MKLFRAISVIVLAFLVMLSSSSFMIGVHLCAGDVQDIAVFSEPEKCAMEKSLPPCHQHLTAPCCDDETIVHEGEGFKASVPKITIATPLVFDVALPEVILSEIIPSAPVAKTHYQNYDPPIRSHDLTVTHQVFLI